jgi:BASS family bile acid:Na+ symporter
MQLVSVIRVTALISITLMVVGLGLRSVRGDATHLLHNPGLLARSLLSTNVVMPLLVIALVSLFELRPEVKIALVALAVSPVPPFLPAKQLRIGAHRAYVYSLLLFTTVLAVVLVPLTMVFMARQAGGRQVGPGHVLSVVTLTTLLPLWLGMSMRNVLPAIAARLAPVADKLGLVLLVVVALLILIRKWSQMGTLIGDGTLLAIVVFTTAGLLVGHVLGGPEPGQRSALALATASRHPAVALAVAQASFPDENLVPAAVLLALVVGLFATAPYAAWRARVHPVEMRL